jgi:hypothetical protein
MNVMKLMVVALAGWISRQQEHVPEDWKTTRCRSLLEDGNRSPSGLEILCQPSTELSESAAANGEVRVAGRLADCFVATPGMPHETDDSSFWTLGVRLLKL